MVKKRKAKAVSKTTKRQSSLAEKTEQILLTMPRIIAAQIGKDLLVQKQQVTKLSQELKKAELRKKELTQKLTVLKMKNTAMARQRAAAIQKTLKKTDQLAKTLALSLETVQKQFQVLSQKKAKYTALQDQLNVFQKEWVKKMNKKMSGKTKAKAKVKVKGKITTLNLPNKQQTLTERGNHPQAAEVIEIIEVPAQDQVEYVQEIVENVS